MTFTDTSIPHFLAETGQNAHETCEYAPKKAKKAANVHYLPPRTAVEPSIPKTPAEALQHMRAIFNAFSGDPAATAELVRGTAILLREIAPHGRPSGHSPPEQAVNPQSEQQTPSQSVTRQFNRQAFTPSEFWLTRDKAKNESPKDFIERVYKDVLGAISRQDLKHYDEPLYNRLNKWFGQPQSDEPDAPKNRLPSSFGPLAKSDELDHLVNHYKEHGADGMSARDFMRAQSAARSQHRRAG
jgi:hypothetical protein